MASEGIACSGDVEAELAATKEAVAAAPPGEIPTVDHEGEGIGGDFVIVNGESNGLSDRGSDPGPRSGEDPLLDEDGQPPPNAGPDVAAGVAHRVASGELGASPADLSVFSGQGDDRAAAVEDGVDEVKGEHVDDFVAELVEQETAGREQGGAEALPASDIDHADVVADSAAPAVDSDGNGNESTTEESAAAVELLVHEGATEEHDGVDASVELSGQDGTFAHGESVSTALQYVVCGEESKGESALQYVVCGEESKGESSAAEVIESVELDEDGLGALMVNGYHDANISADSCLTATEPVSPAHEGKQEQGAANVKQLVEQDAAYREQNDAWPANGHDHLDRSAGSCSSASKFKAYADESIGQQCGKQGASIAEDEVLEGMLDTSSSVCDAYVCEQPIEEEMKTAESVQTQELNTAVVVRSIPLHVNSSDGVDEKELNRPPCPEQVNLAQSDDFSVQTGKHDELKAPCVGLADKSDNGAVATEPGKVVEIEVCSTNVDQVVPGASMEHRTNVAEKDELSNLCADSKSHRDQSELCDTSIAHDEISSTARDKGSSPLNELASPSVEEALQSDVTLEPEVMSTCTYKEMYPSDETCRDICFGDVNSHTKSSHEVETKCLEVVLEEHKNDGEHAHADEANIVEDSSESHRDVDKSNKGDTQVIRQQRIYLIRVPKLAGEDLWAKTQNAQIHMDRLTQERDAVNFRKQKQKAVCDEYRKKLEAARQEEKEARAAHSDKKHDLNNVRSIIGKLNKANSIEEIDEMIARKEKIMEHDTISLKEEKLFIKEINELKAQRKQLCSNMGSKAEISEAFHQKDHIHEQHKTLKKDSDVLFNNLKSLEENTRKIQKSYDDERIVLRKLNEEFRAANEMRQMAYRYWAELKAEPVKKNEYFFKYRKEHSTAFEYLSMGDMEGLQIHCNNQVERVLGIWNKDDDFRNLYVEANKVSTLRRLGTHDGRRLGPEEDPPVIPSNFNRRLSNPSPLTVSSPDIPIFTSEVAPERPVPVAVPVQENSFPVLPSIQISKHAKSKESGRSPHKQTTTAPMSESEDVKHIEEEKARLKEEELELVKKAEELSRKEEELREERVAAEKERLRLEQKAKAKEAEERKKRKAEKAQERAEFKARKEAEVKEKKKAKKDKQNGATPADPASSGGEGNSTAITTAETGSSTSENTRDADVSQQAAPRRTSRSASAMRQLNRVEPMPLPLRNRGRRKIRQYILVAVAVLSVIILIVAGSYIHLPSLRW